MFNPISTYRIQFHAAFTFKDFERIIPYLEQLGVSTIYASPILEASPGSMHGYDTVNPTRINPEIGTLAQLKAIAGRLKKLNINWIQDIVPNHMAFHPLNLWLMDVLEKGPASKYIKFFDINWSGDKNLPLMVPFLDAPLEDTITQGDLKLIAKADKLYLRYFDTDWPVNDKVTSIKTPVREVVNAQYYRLCHWEETNHQINFRRFFTINGLICLNMQDPETFATYHKFIAALLKQGVFQGLRVDHIDGLYDPESYLEQLRNLVGTETYIVVEKILEEEEDVPLLWPIEGNTGYDFLAGANNLFTDDDAKKEFTKYYTRLTGDNKEAQAQITEKKSAILEDFMAGELNNLYQLFLDLELAQENELNTLQTGSLKAAIGAFLIYCPVYRYYGNQLPLKGKNLEGIKTIFKKIGSIKELKAAADLLEKVLLDIPENAGSAYLEKAAEFYLRCMQFTGPLMAKGVEDTLMYTYNRFLGHNEVGDSPELFGLSKDHVHGKMLERQRHWPLSLNATATHDTKRGEDVRARLNVLTSLPDEWIKAVEEWRILNSALPDVPDSNDEYFIYQTLIGSYPMPEREEGNYKIRLQEYLEKALREGKMNSSWADPDRAYEDTVKSFIAGLLDKAAPFWKSFSVLHRKVSDFGIINSLSQLLLKYTCPGIPDVYQGTELWDLSLVDPDNRMPVDYQLRSDWLEELLADPVSIVQLWKERYNGKIKLWLQHVLLMHRKSNALLFEAGNYIPLDVKGRYAKHVFAYARRYQHQWFVIAVPLNLAGLAKKNGENDLVINWKDTHIILPAEMPVEWESMMTVQKGELKEGILKADLIFNDFPMAFLQMKQVPNERGAGILMPVSALPSAYGIGDLGPEAEKFVCFLSRSRQKYWQLLPLNPVGSDQAYSPYSSISSFAGNILLISPDQLAEEGLLEEKYLKKHRIRVKELDFDKATRIKNELLDNAYENFNVCKPAYLQRKFEDFCAQEAYWLDDFALYVVLKEYHQSAPWYKWEQAFKIKDSKVILRFSRSHKAALIKIKWQQFIFFRQWARLRSFAHMQGVKLYGDLPFYAGLDSADVWANPEIFSLDEEHQIVGVAGVPPDYFNAEGQLWGMPVYRWDVLRSTGYTWWLQRIRKNMELYDLLRLDHFRAFCDYWEVPAGTPGVAVTGNWKPGPGAGFFEILKMAFPSLPFVAEDLGKINEDVYLLRDAFHLPGMKVLQFAFGEDMADSEHIPHCFTSGNFVIYTGTHDNNTSLGWYEKDADKAERQRLEDYAGHTVNKKNVHTTLARLAYASIAKIVILPVQDIIGLDSKSRMNSPSSEKGNWVWRMEPGQPGFFKEAQLRFWTEVYGRV